VQDQYGVVEASVFNGDFLTLRHADAFPIVSRLQTHGVRSRRDQELVERACGG
jgi:hypothetical protein